MPMIPSKIDRGRNVAADPAYARYGQVTWRWWCQRHGVEFVLLDKPLGGSAFAEMPPTFQRWLAPELLIGEYGPSARVALIDADTMIRWDAPDLFDAAAPRFSAVADTSSSWIYRSIKAYQSLLPDVALPWWEYFNAGIAVLGVGQLPVVRDFLQFSLERWAELCAIAVSGHYGTDQTPLNLFLRHQGERVHFMPPPFNLANCFPMSDALWRFELDPNPDWADFIDRAFSRTSAFHFVQLGYIWHFTNVVASRHIVMQQTWRRIREYYPGAGEEL